jgi:hypothetical protein
MMWENNTKKCCCCWGYKIKKYKTRKNVVAVGDIK